MGVSAVPSELDLTSSTMGEWEDELDEPVDLNAMQYAGTALGKVNLLLKACFVPDKAVYMQFNSGS